MATISANTALDAAARTAGEAFTIQSGATLTIDTHTRFHANAPAAATGSLGSFTMTAATGGVCFIDGSKVRMVAYSTGTGNVPTYNTSISQGGVSGPLLCVISALNAAPTAVGAAMPASGFILFKSVSGGAFAAGALTGIGATVVGSEVPGFLEIVMDDTAGFTIGRAQTFKTRMQWFSPIDTSGNAVTCNGSRGQQIQFPNFGGANFFLPGVWIETGVGAGTYEFWPACVAGTGTPWATANLGTDARNKFVQCLGGGIIRIGSDGTNNIGDLPASGCKIRIPNVLVKSCAAASRASDSVPNATLTSRPDFTTTNAGVLDVEGMIGHWQINLSQAFSVKLWYVALFDQFTLSEIAAPLDLKETGNGNYSHGDVPAFVLASNFAGGNVVDCKFGRSGTIASIDYSISLSQCNGIVFTRTHAQNRTLRTNAGAVPWRLLQCKDVTFTDCVVVGSSLALDICINTVLNNLKYADSFNATSSATNAPLGALQILSYSTNTMVNGFGWYTSVANVHPDTALIYLSSAIGVKIRNIGSAASKMSAGSSNAMLYFCNDAGNSADIKIQRVYFDLLATTFYLAVNSTKNLEIANCTGNPTVPKTLQSAALNMVVKNVECSGIAPGSTASIYGSSFYHHFTSTTAGRLGLKFSEPTAEYAAYVTTNFTSSATGVSGFNSSQGLALINSGDYAIFEFPWTIVGIDSFQNSAPTITTSTNMTVEYQIDTGTGWNGTWRTFNATNLSGETVDEVAGFKFKIKVSANATNAANILTECYALTNSNSTAQAIEYPLDLATLNISGLVSGSDIVILDPGTATEYANVDALAATSYQFTYDAGVINDADVCVYKTGYLPWSIRSLSLPPAGQSLPVQQMPDRYYLA